MSSHCGFPGELSVFVSGLEALGTSIVSSQHGTQSPWICGFPPSHAVLATPVSRPSDSPVSCSWLLSTQVL